VPTGVRNVARNKRLGDARPDSMTAPRLGTCFQSSRSPQLSRATGAGGIGFNQSRKKPEGRMSQMGQKTDILGQVSMSGLPLKADIDRSRRDVCFVPNSDFPHGSYSMIPSILVPRLSCLELLRINSHHLD
jgi:hypothetical protein